MALRRIVVCGFVAVGLTMGMVAPADASASAKTDADLHCLMIGLKLTGSQNARMRQSGLVATMYYLGRLDARAPNLDLVHRIEAEAPSMSGPVLRADAKRCGHTLSVRGQALQTMGQDLKAWAAKLGARNDAKH